MPPKNPPSVRQLKLIAILKKSATKGGITLAELADQLGMETRTIRRDLTQLIKSEELPIKKKAEAHGRLLYWLEENPLTPSAFKYDEAAALYLGYRFLAPLTGSFIDEAAKEGLQKIKEKLGTDRARWLDRFLRIFRESTTGWSDYSQKADIVATLITACEDRKEIVIRYLPYAAKEERLYTIQPYALITQTGTLYLLGLSCNSNKIQTWKLNRVIEVEKSKTTFKKPKESEIDDFRRRGFGMFVFDDEPVQKVRIKVDGIMAKYVQEHHWHETQQFKQQGDNCVIVQFEVVPTRELTNWILTLGCNAEVLQPKSLREKVAEEIAKMHRRYTSR